MGIEILYDNMVTERGYEAVLSFYAKAVKTGETGEVKRLLGILERSEFSGRLGNDLGKLGL